MKPSDHYRQCMCSECRPPPAAAPPKQHFVLNLTPFEDRLEKNHLKPIADFVNETRAELRTLRKELGLDPGPDVRLTIKTRGAVSAQEQSRFFVEYGDLVILDDQSDEAG